MRLGEDRFTMRVGQRHQQLRTTGERAGKPLNVIGARLRGTEINFAAFDRDGSARAFEGLVDGARMEGRSSGQGIAPLRWSAARD